MPEAYRGATTQTYRRLYGYKAVIAWQKADDLAARVHDVTIGFGPGYWRLSDQMRGAAVSVKSNIAEGYCRAALGDYIRFCEIARGSLGELGSQIQDCERWRVLSGDALSGLLALFSDATFFLEKLIAGLRQKQRSSRREPASAAKEPMAMYGEEINVTLVDLPDEISETLLDRDLAPSGPGPLSLPETPQDAPRPAQE